MRHNSVPTEETSDSHQYRVVTRDLQLRSHTAIRQ